MRKWDRHLKYFFLRQTRKPQISRTGLSLEGLLSLRVLPKMSAQQNSFSNDGSFLAQFMKQTTGSDDAAAARTDQGAEV